MISFLLWNVWQLPSCCTDGRSRSRAHGIASILNNYDVVILNEAFINKSVLLSQCLHPYRHTLGRRWTLFDSGVMILSKYPVVKVMGQHYDKRSGWDRFAAKGILFCRVQIEEKTVDIYGTHMQAGNSVNAHAARMHQGQMVAKFIKTNSSEDSYIILAGDLNMGPTSDPQFKDFSGHYSSPDDACQRNNQYTAMRMQSKLTDVFVSSNKQEDCQWSESINRFLVRNISRASLSINHVVFRDKAGRLLSDTEGVVLIWGRENV